MKNKEALSIDAFKNALRKNDLKATPQRIAVHSAMLKLEHASADMVVEEVSSDANTKITVASVYNILTQLAEVGIYGRRFSCNSKMFFDVVPKAHVHIYDVQNHSYSNLIDEEMMDIIDEYLGRRKFRGYAIQSLDIQLLVKPNRKKIINIKKK